MKAGDIVTHQGKRAIVLRHEPSWLRPEMITQLAVPDQALLPPYITDVTLNDWRPVDPANREGKWYVSGVSGSAYNSRRFEFVCDLAVKVSPLPRPRRATAYRNGRWY